MKCILILITLALPKVSINKNISKDEIKQSIINHGVKWPEIGYAQAVIETGNFKSKLFKKSNNLFGMKVSKRKMHIYKTRNNSCVYFSWQKSIEDYKLFQDRFETKNDFENYLKNHYCSNKKYWKLISLILKKEKFSYIVCKNDTIQNNY